ncbi:hypothetical protein ACIPRL_35595 [Streptomyces sp. NPDC090085]|uniref:hypothetical protein n=1 Tax=Streptomyces sp. NPDC090085 TaxID=3365943 RepID=UPI00381809A1
MQGDDAGGESAVARPWDLQPLGVDVPAPTSWKGTDSRERKQAQRLQESIDRRAADQQLIEILRKDGFEGHRYQVFENDLARYAISVLRAWMYSGYIFTMASSRGYGLNPHELDLERLAADSDLRDELATMTVALALPRFRQRALIEGGWTFAGGAGITTYFMGACLYDFPNEFRRHRAGEAAQRAAQKQPQFIDEILPGVESEIVGREALREAIKAIPPKKLRERAVVALTLDGYTQEEIRLILGEDSVRAIEGVMHRWRKKAAERLEKKGEVRG